MPKDGIVTTYVTLMVEQSETKHQTSQQQQPTTCRPIQYKPNNNQNVKCAITSPPSADIQVNQTETTNTTTGKQ